MSDFDHTQEWLAKEASGDISRSDPALIDAEIQRLRNMIAKAEEQNPIQQWTKAELEDWCRGWCRTPHTTLKAFIDAGFCSDQDPSREEMRLLRQPASSTGDATKAVMSYRGWQIEEDRSCLDVNSTWRAFAPDYDPEIRRFNTWAAARTLPVLTDEIDLAIEERNQ